MRKLQFPYSTNSSFHPIENPRCITMIQSLRPGYRPASRADVAGKLLDKVHDKEIEQCATSIKGKIANLSLDGWSNVHNNPACITTEEGNVFLAETIDTSGILTRISNKSYNKMRTNILTSSMQLGCRQCCKYIQDEKKFRTV